MKKLLGFLMLSLAVFVSFAKEAYLESDGTQYVPINYRANAKTRIVVDFQFVKVESQRAVFGSWGDDKEGKGGAGTCLGFWANNGRNPEGTINGKWTGRLKALPGSNYDGMDTARYQLTADVPNVKFTLVGESGTYTKTVDRSDLEVDDLLLGIFANTLRCGSSDDASLLMRPAAIEGTRNSKLRIYSFKVFEDDDLLADLIPCLKGDVAGFYDRQNDVFYGSVTGSLAYGGDILVLEDDPYVAAPNGGVSINTGYTMTPETRIEVDFALLSVNGSQQQFVFESGGTAADNLMTRVYVNGENGLSWVYDDVHDYTVFLTGTQIPVAPITRRKAFLDSYRSEVGMVTYGVTNVLRTMSTTRTFCSKSTLHLFSNAAGSGNFAKMRIYGMKIFEAGVLKHDFLPMKSFEEGILKDQVTGRTLVSGTDVPLAFGGAIREDAYVESRGGLEIGLDYYPNAKTYIEVDYQITEKGSNNILFGAGIYEDAGFGFQQNNGKNLEFRCHSAWSGGSQFGNADMKRHVAVIDNPNGIVYSRTGCSNNKTQAMSSKSGYVDPAPACLTNLSIFGDTVYNETTKPSKARIFSVLIWEDGELIHQYLPYVKGGVVGFRDGVSGGFFASDSELTLDNLLPGGDISYDDVADAYIESDGTQAIMTDFLPTDKTRVEVDFMLRQSPKSDLYIFGRWDDPYWAFQVNFQKNFTMRTHTGLYSYRETIPGDQVRHTAVLDRKNGICQITDKGEMKSYTALSTSSASSGLPLAIFARSEANGECFGMTKLRLYSFRVYEDDVLMHECLPYKSGETVGLYDTKTGTVLTNGLSGANAFKVGGTAVCGESFGLLVSPTNSFVGVKGAVLLKAYAPGDVTYRWTKDGEVIEGETGAELSVTWQKVRSRESVYTVTPLYHVYSTIVEGQPASATVTYGSTGLVLIFR